MKSNKTKFTTFVLLAAAVYLSGCSLLTSGAKSVVEKYLSHAERYETEAMDALMSDRIVKELGAAKIKRDNERFADALLNGDHKMQMISETVSGDTAKLVFFYRDAAKNDSVKLNFKLVKQNGDWKIDGYGFGDPDEAAALSVVDSKKSGSVA